MYHSSPYRNKHREQNQRNERSPRNQLRTSKHMSQLFQQGKDKDLTSFYWQNGYGAFSISPSHVESVRGYIAARAEHHRHESFPESGSGQAGGISPAMQEIWR